MERSQPSERRVAGSRHRDRTGAEFWSRERRAALVCWTLAGLVALAGLALSTRN